MRRRAVLYLALATAACGPTQEETGSAVLIASPFIVAATALVLALLARLHRRALPDLRVDWRPTAGLVALGSALCAGGVLGGRAGLDRESNALLAFLLIGAAYLVVTLLVWRIWRIFRPAASYGWVQVPMFAVVFLPALLALIGGSLGGGPFAAYLIVALGEIYAWPATLIAVIAFTVELSVVARRRRR